MKFYFTFTPAVTEVNGKLNPNEKNDGKDTANMLTFFRKLCEDILIVNYRADYYFKKTGASGRGTRTQISGPISQHLRGATTESAVLDYLQKKHKGCEIVLMKLEWK